MEITGYFIADLQLIVNELPNWCGIENIINYPSHRLNRKFGICISKQGFYSVLRREGFQNGDFDSCLFDYLNLNFPDLISRKILTNGKIDGKLYFMISNGGFRFHAELFLFPTKFFNLPF